MGLIQVVREETGKGIAEVGLSGYVEIIKRKGMDQDKIVRNLFDNQFEYE
jgi:hypothetical protein